MRKLLYTFRCSIACSTRRHAMFVNAMSTAYYEQSFPEEIRELLSQFDDNDDGYMTTSCKMKADILLTFMSTLNGWKGKIKPIRMRTLPIGGEDPRGR